MADNHIFQLTLGPVQGFVAQARRTRDFWAGSFILSWLSSVAMASIREQGGTIQFPQPADNYFAWLYGEQKNHALVDAPLQGSIPNRFQALTATVPSAFEPALVTQAINTAWQALAAAVWQQDLSHLQGSVTETIWQRQLANFWEISWVLSDTANSNLLDRRKNWRSPVASNEPGNKCMMMDGWQELSGITESNMTKVNAFWSELMLHGGRAIQTDIKTGERPEHLCAMAFIKRRFVHCFDKVAFTLPGTQKQLGGWKLPSAVPSTSFVAAAHWIAALIQRADTTLLAQFHEAAKEIASYGELEHIDNVKYPIDILCVTQAITARLDIKRHWSGLDGQVYFDTALENSNIFADQGKARRVLQLLKQLREQANLPKPSPFYAVLRMDGDQLGSHMSDPSKQQPISEALNAFTQSAAEIVQQHNGFLIYAGGDDVLALLPASDAMPAAYKLQAFYKDCFAKHTQQRVASTLSAAIEYVHIRTPLTRVLQDSHQLLDDIAKDQCGRDALAVRVWKPTGLAAEWFMPWQKTTGADGSLTLMQLAQQFAQQGADDAYFSNKFFFRAQRLIERVPADVANHATALQKMLYAEFLDSFNGRAKQQNALKLDQLGNAFTALIEQSIRWQRTVDDRGQVHFNQTGFNADTALLLRFLAEYAQEVGA